MASAALAALCADGSPQQTRGRVGHVERTLRRQIRRHGGLRQAVAFRALRFGDPEEELAAELAGVLGLGEADETARDGFAAAGDDAVETDAADHPVEGKIPAVRGNDDLLAQEQP